MWIFRYMSGKSGCFSPKTPKTGSKTGFKGLLRRLSGGKEHVSYLIMTNKFFVSRDFELVKPIMPPGTQQFRASRTIGLKPSFWKSLICVGVAKSCRDDLHLSSLSLINDNSYRKRGGGRKVMTNIITEELLRIWVWLSLGLGRSELGRSMGSITPIGSIMDQLIYAN